MKFIIGLLILCSLVFIAFRLKRYRLFSNLLLFAVTIAATLFFIESIYRSFIRNPTVHTLSQMPLTRDPVLGLKIEKPAEYNATNIYENGDTVFSVRYQILDDTLGNGPALPFRTGYQNRNSNKEVVFIGCSFTFGVGLEDEETLPIQFGRLTGISSVNRAVGSWGIHQVYESFRLKYGTLNNSNRIFVYSLLPDHFIRATGIYEWNSYGPYYTLKEDSLINEGVKETITTAKEIKPGRILKHLTFLQPYLSRSQRKSQLEKVSPENLQVGFKMIGELARMVNNSGGKLIILYWDDERFEAKGIKVMGPGRIYDSISSNLIGAQVQLKKLSEVLDYADERNFIKNDGHPSAEANRKIAKQLVENLAGFN